MPSRVAPVAAVGFKFVSAPHLLIVRDGKGLGTQAVRLARRLRVGNRRASGVATAAAPGWGTQQGLPAATTPNCSPCNGHQMPAQLTQWYLTKFLKLTAAACRTSTGTDWSVISWAQGGAGGAGQHQLATAER